jgi:AcrR family transcriptional regulator
MSSESTRERVLGATLALLEGAVGPISMSAIAKAAGLSRQALYLLFEDRADLFISLVRHVDERRGLAEELANIAKAPTGVDAMMMAVDLQARANPSLKPLVDAVELLRRQDPAMERAWQDRLANRLSGARSIVRRMSAEGTLRPHLDEATAADLLWSITSLRMWDDLVAQRGWTADQYRERVGGLLLKALAR